MDSGSTISIANVAKHFPAYSDFILPSRGSLVGETATTACGVELKNHGKCVVHGQAGDQEISIPFQHMDVELPILSARKCCKTGKRVVLEDGGGLLQDFKSGKSVKICEIGGVYYLKFKVNLPPDGQKRHVVPVEPFDAMSPSPFQRLGR